MDEPAIGTYEAPSDFPDKLPTLPSTEDEIYRLLEVWGNVTHINSLRVED